MPDAEPSSQRRAVRGEPRHATVTQQGRSFRESAPTPCDFCANDPAGRAAAALRPCDYANISRNIILECSNCANHRFSTSQPHSCVVSKRGRIAFRRYADAHPISYGDMKCDSCASVRSKSGSCDVDALLGYSCTECKNRDCHVRGVLMETRPNVPQNEKRWLRHGCSTCHAMNQGKTTVVQGCSWLHNRLSWDSACDQCESHPCLCLDGGIAVAFAEVEPPKTWAISRQETRGLINLTNAGLWRFPCQWCANSGEKCRASTLAPGNACNRCSVYGIDCLGRNGELYPIFDLSHVGFGRIMAIHACTRCVTTGRHCDRQRPCDSCVNHGEDDLCDAPSDEHRRRFSQPPGPLYYLALGYGALGVDDVKDGSRIEHWIGPPWPAYVTHEQDPKRWQSITTRMEIARADFLPEGKPPHGAPGGPMANLRPSQTTVEQLVNALKVQWPAVKPPKEYFPDFDERVTAAKARIEARGPRQRTTLQGFEASPSIATPGTVESTAMSSEEPPVRRESPMLDEILDGLDAQYRAAMGSTLPAGASPTLNEILDGLEAQSGLNLNELGRGLPPFSEAYEGERRFLALVQMDEPFIFDDGAIVQPEIERQRPEPQSLRRMHEPAFLSNDGRQAVPFVGGARPRQRPAAHISSQGRDAQQQPAQHAPHAAMSTKQHRDEQPSTIWTVPENAVQAPGILIQEQRGQQQQRGPRPSGPINTRGDRNSLGLMTTGSHYSQCFPTKLPGR
ncbi:hypothetical protein NLU13_0732 [Sarocladium strictum]|uniref:Uncharacterized protein n=1 Tax=Sarocladium strictum TaxID=5046 RepID=A0AA39LB29_SARSR|nr:hypothetical protein NLU13_0732 [Sarocladium strictum]